MFRKQFSEVEDACALAQAMVDTVREPLIVLDKDLRVVAASRSFYVKSQRSLTTPKASIFMNWATASGIFQSFACSWKISYLNKVRWTSMRLNICFPVSDEGHCY